MVRGRQPKRAVQTASSDEGEAEEAPSSRQQHKRVPVGGRRVPQARPTSKEEGSEEPSSSSGGEDPGNSSGASEPESEDGASSGSGSEPEEAGPVSNIPFGELERLRQDGSTTAAAMRARARALKAQGRSFKRAGRHRPMEMSSKKPVPIFRDTIQAPKREARDPRFESLSGQYVEGRFKKQYAFLYDEKLPAEKKELKAALHKVKAPAKRAELQARLVRVDQQLRNEAARRRKEAFERDLKAKEKAAVAGGKAPFYLKKAEKRRLELVAKYEELKAAGQLDKYMAKRRKKNAAKDHRYLPVGRRGGDE